MISTKKSTRLAMMAVVSALAFSASGSVVAASYKGYWTQNHFRPVEASQRHKQQDQRFTQTVKVSPVAKTQVAALPKQQQQNGKADIVAADQSDNRGAKHQLIALNQHENGIRKRISR